MRLDVGCYLVIDKLPLAFQFERHQVLVRHEVDAVDGTLVDRLLNRVVVVTMLVVRARAPMVILEG